MMGCFKRGKGLKKENVLFLFLLLLCGHFTWGRSYLGSESSVRAAFLLKRILCRCVWVTAKNHMFRIWKGSKATRYFVI